MVVELLELEQKVLVEEWVQVEVDAMVREIKDWMLVGALEWAVVLVLVGALEWAVVLVLVVVLEQAGVLLSVEVLEQAVVLVLVVRFLLDGLLIQPLQNLLF